MLSRTHDLIVAGGGFAGLACAEAAARCGLNTLLLERKPWPGTQVASTGIIVKEISEQWGPPLRLVRKIEGVRLYSPSLHHVDLHSAGYSFLATDTPELARWHSRRAIDAGAAIRFNTPYRTSSSARGLQIVNGGQFRARILAGCDGARSRLARDRGLGLNSEFIIGVEAELAPLPQVDPAFLHVFLDGELAPGYIGWVVPGVHSTQVGLGCRLPRRPHLRAFLSRLAHAFRFDDVRVRRFRSGLIPCGGPVMPWHAPGIMLLGDAAGMVSPLTAGGIQPAVSLGRLAGEAIADYLAAGGLEPHGVLGTHLPSWFCKRLLRRLFEFAPARGGMYDLLIGNLAFQSLAQLLFFHQRGLWSPEAWRDLVRFIHDH